MACATVLQGHVLMKKRKSGLQILCFCCWMGTVPQQAPAASLLSVNQQKCALEFAPAKKYLPLWPSGLKPSKLAFPIWRNNPHFGVL